MDSVKIFFSIIGSASEVIFGLFYFYLITLYFPIDIVGYYQAIIAFFTTLAFIIDLGFSIGHLKYYSEASDIHDKSLCNGAFLYFKIIQFLIYIIMSMVLIVFFPIYPGDFGIVFVLFLGTTLVFTQYLFQPLLYSKKQVIKNNIAITGAALIRVFLIIILTSYFKNDLWLLSYLLLISNLFFFTMNIIFVKNFKFKKPDKEHLMKYFKYAFPFFITTSLIIIVSNIDILFLKLWNYPIEEVANYSLAKKFYAYIFIFMTGISNILISTFSKNIQVEENKKNLSIIEESHRILNIITVSINIIVLLYLTDFIVLIFGEEYKMAGFILSILSLVMLTFSVNIANISQLQALGEVKLVAKISITENIIALILMILFIYPSIFSLGAIGGALAIVLSSIIVQLIFRPILYKKFNLKFYFGSFRNILIMVGVIIFQMLINVFINYPIYFMPIFMVLDILIYFLINYLVKGISKDDIKFIFSILSIKNIKKVIALELNSLE